MKSKTNNPLLGEFMVEWFEQHKQKLKPNTINGYSRNINDYIIPQLGKVRINELSLTQIEAFYDYLIIERRLSTTTVLYVHKVLRMGLNVAADRNLIYTNPCSRIKSLKAQTYDALHLSADQRKQLLIMVHGADCELEIVLAAVLGMRLGEVLGLRYSDIDFRNRKIYVRQQVTNVHDEAYIKENPDERAWGILEVECERALWAPPAILSLIEKRRKQAHLLQGAFSKEYYNLDIICSKSNGDIQRPLTIYRKFKAIIRTQPDFPDLRFQDLTYCFKAILDANVAQCEQAVPSINAIAEMQAFVRSHPRFEQAKDVIMNMTYSEYMEFLTLNDRAVIDRFIFGKKS